MSKWCWNWETGQDEDIDEDGYSWTQGKYVNNWDDGPYREEREREEREERRREEDDRW